MLAISCNDKHARHNHSNDVDVDRKPVNYAASEALAARNPYNTASMALPLYHHDDCHCDDIATVHISQAPHVAAP